MWKHAPRITTARRGASGLVEMPWLVYSLQVETIVVVVVVVVAVAVAVAVVVAM
jgi:hypothetical protein